jgi:alanine racemase
MKKELRKGLRTWIEIDKKAIAHNYRSFRALITPETKLMGVVKSNAYGHNLIEFAQELEKLKVDYLAVDSVVEGIALRREGIKSPILILGYILPEMIEKAVTNNLDITVSNFDYFNEIRKLKLKNKLRVHIKVDTGMHRHGFQEKDIKKVISQIRMTRQIEVVGLYTHFASAKDPAFPKKTKNQIKIFKVWREAFMKAGLKPICHACATSGTILFPEAHFDMVRVGIGLYGIWPSAETREYAQKGNSDNDFFGPRVAIGRAQPDTQKSLSKQPFNLLPALSWKTIIGEINNIKKEEGIGYDFTEKLKRDSKVAVIPVGYWHGFPRALSGIGQVIVNGQRAKVLGRICMDIIMVDVTDIKKVKVGDEVTIIGQDGEEVITVDDVAGLLSGSAYEFITRLNPLIKRIYL